MYTEKQLQQCFNLSPNAIRDRIKHLKLKPIKGDRGKNFYTDEQIQLLKSQHEHLASGGSLSSFAPPIKAEIVTTKTRKLAVARSTMELEKFKDTCTELSYADPFWNYELLQRASDKSYYLPTEKLAILVERSPSSFTDKKSFTYSGFVIVRQSDRSGNSFVWAVNANQ